MIAAMAENRAIGVNNTIPWHIPEDFRYFKRITMGKPIIMGRKTFESLPGILPGRPHLIISRGGFEHENTQSFTAIDDAIDTASQMASEAGHKEVFIIGGAQIYKQCLTRADRLYLTEIKMDIEGDAFFPEFDKKTWREISRTPHDGEPAYDFVVYERV